MSQAVKFAYVLVLAVWIGSIVFFSFVVAPSVFRTLDAEDAGKLIRKIFSHYYLVGIICAAAGIVCVGILLAERQFAKWPGVLSLLLLAAMGAADLWMRQAASPHMNDLRDRIAVITDSGQQPEPALQKEWKTLHRLSVQLNAGVLVCGLVLLFLFVYRI
jgi:uncharacterized membrane protein